VIISLGCVVEGHAEVKAVPVLLRRIVHQLLPGSPINVPEPVRVSRTRILRPQELERAVGLAALKAGSRGAVLVLLDSEDDCPMQLAPACWSGQGRLDLTFQWPWFSQKGNTKPGSWPPQSPCEEREGFARTWNHQRTRRASAEPRSG
jgi:hypothetical protein